MGGPHVACRLYVFKKTSCRPAKFKKTSCRMSLKPKKGRVAVSILRVHTPKSTKIMFSTVPK